MKTNKDWADALREQCFPEAVSPSEGSWADITAALRRRTARRWSLAAALALLLPLAGVLLFRPNPSVPVIALGHTVLEPKAELLAMTLPKVRVVSIQPGAVPQKTAVPVIDEPDFLVDNMETHEIQLLETSSIEGYASEKEIVALESVPKPLEESFTDYPDTTEQSVRRLRRFSFSVQAGSAAGYMDKQGGDYGHPNFKYQHDIPLSLGVTMCWGFSSRMALESGITYTYLHSYAESVGHQRLHFIGLPLKLDVHLFSGGPIEVGLGTYGMAEKCVSVVVEDYRSREPALQWSAGVFLDAGYKLTPFATLYFQPSLSYYFTETVLRTYRTEHPLSFTFQAGLRFNL